MAARIGFVLTSFNHVEVSGQYLPYRVRKLVKHLFPELIAERELIGSIDVSKTNIAPW